MPVHINKDITVDISLVGKANKTYKDQYCINVCLVVNNKGIKQDQKMVSTGINILKTSWEQGKVKGRSDEVKETNTRLNNCITDASLMLTELAAKKPKTALEVIKEIKYNAKQRITGKACKQAKEDFTSKLIDYNYETIMNKCLVHNKPCKERQLKYSVPFRYLKEYFGNDLPNINDITSEDLQDFRGWLVDKFKAKVKVGGTFKQNTIVSYCCMVAAVFNYAKKLKLITESPLPVGFSGSFEDGKRDIISEDEIISIQQIPDYTLTSGLLWSKYCLLFQAMTGLGIKEMRSVKYEHIKSENFNGFVKEYLQKDRTKTGIEYIVMLTSNAKYIRDKLIQLIGNDDRPFNLCSDSLINRHYRTLAAKVGITKCVSPYQFRHAFAVSFMNNDGRLEDLQKILGHKDPSTTAIYGKISKERLADKTDILESKSRMHQLHPIKNLRPIAELLAV